MRTPYYSSFPVRDSASTRRRTSPSTYNPREWISSVIFRIPDGNLSAPNHHISESIGACSMWNTHSRRCRQRRSVPSLHSNRRFQRTHNLHPAKDHQHIPKNMRFWVTHSKAEWFHEACTLEHDGFINIALWRWSG